MHRLAVDPATIRAAYAGAERALWELLMGEQIHIGGLTSSLDLAARAGVRPGSRVVDLCCCTGAGLRCLRRFRGVGACTGVDMTAEALALGEARNREQGMADVRLVCADATATGLPDGGCDLVWGEDAWCYVPDKAALAREAARLCARGGIVAFTDWTCGPVAMSGAEAERFLRFMKFPSLPSIAEWWSLLADAGLRVELAEDTGRFAGALDLYLGLVSQQFGWDALRLVGFDQGALAAIGGEMAFAAGLARAGKLVQARFVARRA